MGVDVGPPPPSPSGMSVSADVLLWRGDLCRPEDARWSSKWEGESQMMLAMYVSSILPDGPALDPPRTEPG